MLKRYFFAMAIVFGIFFNCQVSRTDRDGDDSSEGAVSQTEQGTSENGDSGSSQGNTSDSSQGDAGTAGTNSADTGTGSTDSDAGTTVDSDSGGTNTGDAGSFTGGDSGQITAISHKDVVYGTYYSTSEGTNKNLLMDIHLPVQTAAEKSAVIVWINGKLWKDGNRKECPYQDFINFKYAVACVEYRPTTEKKFPAQLHDVKGAVRFLRAKASTYSLDANMIVAVGESGGGHLAALLGLTYGISMPGVVNDMEGTVGGNTQYGSDVQAVVDLYGPTDLQGILQKVTGVWSEESYQAAINLLGGPMESYTYELAGAADPATYERDATTPFLIFHGGRDGFVPEIHSERLQSSLGNSLAELLVFEDWGHFYNDEGKKDKMDAALLEYIIKFLSAI